MQEVENNGETRQDMDDSTPDQIDALREIGNIGASHASTALTTMLHQDIMVTYRNASSVRPWRRPTRLGDVEKIRGRGLHGSERQGERKHAPVLTEEVAKRMTDMLFSRTMTRPRSSTRKTGRLSRRSVTSRFGLSERHLRSAGIPCCQHRQASRSACSVRC